MNVLTAARAVSVAPLATLRAHPDLIELSNSGRLRCLLFLGCRMPHPTQQIHLYYGILRYVFVYSYTADCLIPNKLYVILV
ncbi:unnamed protein product [Strongylus vulgaris]|uniref:Uncharacterized protein n=1 Tax=Strongylus vulgaris TaxID=40348 RepID=A0A3P7JTE0_STRVU|nr:unnamed protein product [Strongylus vulgaris]